jgi:hypothetical protein
MLVTVDVSCQWMLAHRLVCFQETTNLIVTSSDRESKPLEEKYIGHKHLQKQQHHQMRKTYTSKALSEFSLDVYLYLELSETSKLSVPNMEETLTS